MRDVDIEFAELRRDEPERGLGDPDGHGLDVSFSTPWAVSSITLTLVGNRGKAGGTASSLNVMFVLDATGSMGEADSNCTNVPGFNDAATSPRGPRRASSARSIRSRAC